MKYPVCNQGSMFEKFRLDECIFSQCVRCNLLKFDNPPSKKSLVDMYSKDKAKGDDEYRNPLLYLLGSFGLGRLLFHLLKSYIYKQRAVSITKNINPGSLLDIGCGEGQFLRESSIVGWKISGLEISRSLASMAKEKSKCPIIVSDIDSDRLKSYFKYKFDVITMWHVLEHLPNPKKSILNLSKLLKPTGHLVIEVPHSESFSIDIFKQYWTLLLVPQHLYIRSKKSFESLFYSCQMKIVRVEYPVHFPFVPLSSLVKKYQFLKYLFPLFVPMSILISILFSMCSKGEVIRVYARKI